MRYLLALFKISNILVVIATLLAYVSPFISPADFWELSLFGLAYPFLLAANIVFILFWTFVQRRWIWVSLFTIVLGFNHIGGVLNFSLPFGKSGDYVSLITYNLGSFYQFNKKWKFRIKNEHQLYLFLKKNHPDLTVIQEFAQGKRRQEWVLDSFKLHQIDRKFEFIHNLVYYHGLDQKIENKGAIGFKRNNGATYVDTKLNGQLVRVYNLHLKSNHISVETHRFNFKKDLLSRKIIPYGKHVYKQIKKAGQIRAMQVEEIKLHINSSPHPVIVTGDFNDVPVSYTYRQLSKNLKDAFREKGQGFGFTYNGKLPGLRLDYVLVSPEIEVIDFQIPKVDFSDHYPIICRLKIPR